MRKLSKQILAYALAATMIITSAPITGNKAVAAESSALILGADYIITSKSSGKVLDVEGDSTEEGAKIIQATADDTDDFQVWTVTDGGDGYYNLVNKVSGKGIDVPNSSKKEGTELKQYNNASNRNYQKFAITDDDGDGYYRITPKQVSDFAIRVKDDSKEDGATLVQQKAEGADCEKWSFQLIKSDYAIADYEAVAREAYDSWLAKFFYVDEYGYGRLNNINGCWTEFEVLEMCIDAYEHFGDEKYLTVAEQLYEGLMDKRNTNWSWNGYTDDTMYMTIATIRLYLVTNDPRQLNVAVKNFDMVYKRAVKEDGVLVWCIDEDKQYKNACANCPAMIAAIYLGHATGDTSYYDKAAQIWEWVYPNLFEEQYQKTGGYDDTGIQGIFIGSSALLYSVTGEQKYKDVALRACEVAKTLGKGANEILDGEGVKGGDYNSVAAKGILARWLGYFTELCPEIDQFDYWMEINADSAWAHRNSDNLMWGHFGTQTMEKVEECEEYYDSVDNVQKKRYASWACSAAVSWLINCTGIPVVGTRVENANKMEAEDAVINGGAVVKKESECSKGKCVDKVGVREGSVEFTFNSDGDGEALLSLYYVADKAGKFNVTVNGKNTYTVDCPLTEDGNNTSIPACISVDFVEGDNTVVVAGVRGETSPKLDYVGVNCPDYIEMEAGYREHGARTGNNENCSGGRSMEWMGGEKGGSVTFMIPAEAGGRAKVTFPYAADGNRKVNVIVNGKSNAVDCKSTKSWDVFATEPLTLDVDLQKGMNEIIFTGVEKATAPNLDFFEMEWPYNQAEIADEDTIIPEATSEDLEMADAVIAAIKKLGTITLNSEESIQAAEDAYNKLSQDQKALVTNYEDLTKAREEYTQLKEEYDKAAEDKAAQDKIAADAVIAAIENIGTDITVEDAAMIKEVQAAYDGLSDEQKKLISDEQLAALENAVATMEELQIKADQAAADKVIELISLVGTATLENEANIKAAREAYDALTEDQKKLVTNYKDLEAAETEVAKQKAEKEEIEKEEAEDEETDNQAVTKRETFTYKNIKYKVINANMKGKGTVEVIGPKKNTQKTVTIPSSVKRKGATFKVTSIRKYAFKNCKKLKKVTIGKNVTKIGKYAFSGCSKLKTIKIQTKNLKNVGKNTFKGIHENAKIKVPSSNLKKYKKLLKKKGQSKTVTITK